MEREIYRAVPERIRSQELWVLYETEAMENLLWTLLHTPSP